MRKNIMAGLMSALMLCCAAEAGRAAEPLDNVALPQGSFFLAYPQYYSAGRIMDKNGNALPARPRAASYQSTFKYTYADKNILPNTLLFSVILPAGCVEMYGDRDCGIGDLSLLGGYWFVDDPDAKTWFGAKLQVFAPTGHFDKNRKANMGSNAWKFRPTLYAAKRWGDIHAELTARYTIYTTNDDTATRQGDDVITEGYIGWFLRPDLLLGGHLNATLGQDRTVSGATVHDSGVQIFQAGASLYVKCGAGFSVVIEGLSDFAVKNSTEGYTVLARLIWKL